MIILPSAFLRNYQSVFHSICNSFHSLAMFKILSLSLSFWKLDYKVSWCESLLVHVTWNSLSFLDVCVHFMLDIELPEYHLSLIKFEKYSDITFSNILSAFSFSLLFLCVGCLASHNSLKFCSLFFNLFSFCFSESILSIVFKFITLIWLLKSDFWIPLEKILF